MHSTSRNAAENGATVVATGIAPQPWHAATVAEVLLRIGARPEGLTDTEAAQRLLA